MKKVKVEIDINHLAKLASLALGEKEKNTYQKQLTEVLTYISKLNEVNTEKVEQIGHITGLVNVVRDDQAAPSITQQEALSNAPRTYNGFFEVDAIFDQDDQ